MKDDLQMKVEMKGIHKVPKKRADGSIEKYYYYAWRGGPPLRGEEGSPEFHASFNEAIENRRAPDMSKFKSIVVLYRGSNDFKKNADTTRKNWSPWLDRIADYFGELRIAVFDHPQKIRPVIVRWRNRWSDKPRTADYGMQVLSRVLSYGVDPLGKIASNACDGIKQLYSNDRSDIIWTDPDIAKLKKTCSPEIANAVDLAVHTGLREGDLVQLAWSHIGEDAIVIATKKSRYRREAIIPLYDDLRNVLASIPKRSPIVLTNSLGQPWKANTLSTAFRRAKKKAGIQEPPQGLRFHDLRGTAATKFYVAGLSIRVIAEILAWSEEEVDGIIRRYVSRSAATKEVIRQLNAATKQRT